MLLLLLLLLAASANTAQAFVGAAPRAVAAMSAAGSRPQPPAFDPLGLAESKVAGAGGKKNRAVAALPVAALGVAGAAAPAVAADDSGFALASAAAAYGHYASLLAMMACVVSERFIIKEGTTKEEETLFWAVDAAYGVAGVGLTISGYLRATQYAKGWEFYSHSPVFWVKMSLLAVLGAASFFPTTIAISRAVKFSKEDGPEYTPMSPALVKRLHTIINGEILALLAIPLSATLMARGVGYTDWFPTQVGIPFALAILVGLGQKYVREALSFPEEAKA